MIFGKGECRRTSNENLTKSAKIAAFWQGSFYSCLAFRRETLLRICPLNQKITVYKRNVRFSPYKSSHSDQKTVSTDVETVFLFFGEEFIMPYTVRHGQARLSTKDRLFRTFAWLRVNSRLYSYRHTDRQD